MINKKSIFILVVIIIVVGAGVYYFKNQKLVPGLVFVADDKGSTSAGIRAVIDNNNQFALDLYSQLKNTGGNIFFSPYSLSTALAMVYEGANGKTADEIRAAFHFPADNMTRRSSFAAIYNLLNIPNSDYTLKVANALWAQNDYKFLDSYLNTVQQYYDGKAMNIDFINSTESARLTINKWIEDQTNNKIKDLFPSDSLDSQTRLVLTNAIYFKGTWAKQFEKNLTKDSDFRVSSTDIIRTPIMQQTDEDAKFNYSEDDNLQILELPYKGDKLSMLILLPKNDDLSTLEGLLSTDKINGWRSQLSEQRVDVFLPKFVFNTKYFMNDTLIKMGMPTAFANNADFSGMDGTQDLYIAKVIHQAFIDVNEEGTEAAAATGVSMGIKSMAPEKAIVFRADHPFIFIIQDKDNGSILFFGKVSNPKE